LSSPKKQKRDKESKHELEEIKKDNIEAEKKTEVEIDPKENSDEGIAERSASIFISQKLLAQ
jgi:hypothetical protein